MRKAIITISILFITAILIASALSWAVNNGAFADHLNNNEFLRRLFYWFVFAFFGVGGVYKLLDEPLTRWLSDRKPPDKDKQIQKNRDQAATWFNRAGMAYQQNNYELALQALDRCWQYKKAVCDLTGEEPPKRPTTKDDIEIWLAQPPWPPPSKGPNKPGDPFQPSGVPRKPLPTAGAGEVALPLPENHTDDKED